MGGKYEMSGTERIETKKLVLRKHVKEDADWLYLYLGMDPKMYAYSGWNPYATKAMAHKTIQTFIDHYDDDFFFSWAIELNGELIGTIGAYDHNVELNSIEVGISIERRNWSKGYASEALQAVLQYLTAQKKIKVVKAWCAAENQGSKRVMEKCGMKFINVEHSALCINGKIFDRLNYEYQNQMLENVSVV
jgi:ribosomal-protein-alanine N-acetyltransferase